MKIAIEFNFLSNVSKRVYIGMYIFSLLTGFTPLILAATAGHVDVVEILLEHDAEIEAQSERTKDTPLSLACSGGRYDVSIYYLTFFFFFLHYILDNLQSSHNGSSC